MNSRISIVQRNETIGPKQATTKGKATEMVPNREMVVLVKNWIDEFKLRSRQETLVTLTMPHKA